MGIRKRILKYIEYKGISKYKFYQETGFSNGFLDKEGSIGADKCEKISYQYPDISLDWLITGQGEMLKSEAQKESELSMESIPLNPVATNVLSAISAHESGIPLYDVSAAGGYGSFDEMIDREKLVGNYSIPGFANIDWMIYVAGASMYPKYSSGDIIACRVLHESRFIQWGKVYVLATREQGILVKRLKKCQDENYLTAVCDNPAYDSFDVPKDEILGIALVVGVIRLE